MARTLIPLTEINRAGTAPGVEATYDTVNKNTITNDGNVLLQVRNAHATVAQTFQVNVPSTVDGQAVVPRVNSVPATTTKWYGPFPLSSYGPSIDIDASTVDIKIIAYHFIHS